MKMSSPFTHYVSLFGFATILAYSFLVVTAHPAEEVSNEERKIGCGEIMEPCSLSNDCCEQLTCDNGRCFPVNGNHKSKIDTDQIQERAVVLHLICFTVF